MSGAGPGVGLGAGPGVGLGGGPGVRLAAGPGLGSAVAPAVTVGRVVGARAVVAVCTLTTGNLAARLRSVPGVGLAGPLMTANLGIEALVRSVLYRPRLRVLLVCGKDSPLFRQGQSLVALGVAGVHAGDHRIIGALGYHPFLPGLRRFELDAFHALVQVVDMRNVLDPALLAARIGELAGQHADARARPPVSAAVPRFEVLRPAGRRMPIRAAGNGFFVISVDRAAGQVLLRHYRADYTPGHEMRGHRAESMVLGLIAAGLVTDLGHAGYLGAELSKAESALRLGLEYEQDLPLRDRIVPAPGN